jgi:2,3-bisphosphoglycerate-independent phosphoglycerate mutase
MGNSEVGHMSIGAGRILYQDLVKVTLAIEDGSIEENVALNGTLSKSNRVHIIGLLSDGGVHSHIEHIIGLAKLAEKRGKEVFLHLITDGRDVYKASACKYIEQIENICSSQISIATLAGRFHTMDRDNRWERVEGGYKAMVNAEPSTSLDAQSYVEESYKKEIMDEFLEPVALNGYEGMQENDAVVIANFRSDRVREITMALGDESFDGFERKYLPLNITTLTKYAANFTYPIMFEKEVPKNTLAEVVSNAKLSQLHTAETEKYAHVTFFLNGGVEEPMIGESRVLIPSPDVKTYDMKPEMSAKEVGVAVRTGMDEKYDLIIVNFANGDMVGHTGNYEAACLAVSAVDTELGQIIEKAKNDDYSIVLTSDHGNCEEMKDTEGKMLTNHTVGEVWCYVLDKSVKKLKDKGSLTNVAATVLEIMRVEVPQEMNSSLVC